VVHRVPRQKPGWEENGFKKEIQVGVWDEDPGWEWETTFHHGSPLDRSVLERNRESLAK
jgi:hypothetical protein